MISSPPGAVSRLRDRRSGNGITTTSPFTNHGKLEICLTGNCSQFPCTSRLFLLGSEPVFPERGLAREGGLPAPGFEKPDEVEHLTARPGREVVQPTDDLLLYPGHGGLTSGYIDPLLQSTYRCLMKGCLSTRSCAPHRGKKIKRGLLTTTFISYPSLSPIHQVKPVMSDVTIGVPRGHRSGASAPSRCRSDRAATGTCRGTIPAGYPLFRESGGACRDEPVGVGGTARGAEDPPALLRRGPRSGQAPMPLAESQLLAADSPLDGRPYRSPSTLFIELHFQCNRLRSSIWGNLHTPCGLERGRGTGRQPAGGDRDPGTPVSRGGCAWSTPPIRLWCACSNRSSTRGSMAFRHNPRLLFCRPIRVDEYLRISREYLNV